MYPRLLELGPVTVYTYGLLLAAAYLLDPEFVTRSEQRYLDVQTTWGQFYGSTTPLDRRASPASTPVTVMLGLDFKRVFTLYKDKLIKAE